MEIVDPKLQEQGIEEKDVMQAFHVALLCLQPHADLRPAMSEIVAMLTFKVEMVTTKQWGGAATGMVSRPNSPNISSYSYSMRLKFIITFLGSRYL